MWGLDKIADIGKVAAGGLIPMAGPGVQASGIGGLFGGGGQPEETEAEKAQEKANEEQQAMVDKSKSHAQAYRAQADKFRKDLPQYTGNQIASAQDSAKRNLATDIYNVKAGMNSRGMLYSGLNEGAQAGAKGQESSKLAGNIQDINQKANQQADIKDQLATNAEQSADAQEVDLQRAKAGQSQGNYDNALKQRQNQQQFFSDISGGVGSIIGMFTGMKGSG